VTLSTAQIEAPNRLNMLNIILARGFIVIIARPPPKVKEKGSYC